MVLQQPGFACGRPMVGRFALGDDDIVNTSGFQTKRFKLPRVSRTQADLDTLRQAAARKTVWKGAQAG